MLKKNGIEWAIYNVSSKFSLANESGLIVLIWLFCSHNNPKLINALNALGGNSASLHSRRSLVKMGKQNQKFLIRLSIQLIILIFSTYSSIKSVKPAKVCGPILVIGLYDKFLINKKFNWMKTN